MAPHPYHTCPPPLLPCMPSLPCTPHLCHTCSPPCMPPAMHAPHHACPPATRTRHACPLPAMHACRVDRMTHTCKNITFPQTLFASSKKMAAKGGHIAFMFLGPPPPYKAAGSATVLSRIIQSPCSIDKNRPESVSGEAQREIYPVCWEVKIEEAFRARSN